MGRGGTADHHRAAEEDHADLQAAGTQKALPGAGGHRRLRRSAGIAQEDRGRRFGHAVHPRAPHADKHLGLVAEAAAHQRSGPREHAVHLHLAPPEPAGAGGGAGGAQRPAAEAGAFIDVPGGHQGALQLLVHLLPQGQGQHVLQALGGAFRGGRRRRPSSR